MVLIHMTSLEMLGGLVLYGQGGEQCRILKEVGDRNALGVYEDPFLSLTCKSLLW